MQPNNMSEEKQYIINQETLMLVKKILDNYICHDIHCSVNIADICNCGLVKDRNKYAKQISHLTEYTEEKDSL